MSRVSLVLLMAILVFAACETKPLYYVERSPDMELAEVELAVARVMAAPAPDVIDLTTDSRLACDQGGCVMCDDDPTVNECTRNMGNVPGGLITLSDNSGEGYSQVYPVSEYLDEDTTEHYYCVHADGRVEGFLEDGTNIRDLK